MKHLFLALLLIILTIPSAMAQTTIAVLDLEMQAGVPSSYQGALTDMLREELFHTGQFRVIERNAMEEILTEQGFQLSGCVSNECAVEVGQMLGVEQMVAGSVSAIGEIHAIAIRLIDVESGEIVGMESVRCQCSIEDIILTRMTEVVSLLTSSNHDETSVSQPDQEMEESESPVDDGIIPENFALFSPDPDPFHDSCSIVYHVPETARVVIKIYDTRGRLISTIKDSIHQPGVYQYQIDGNGLDSGIYFIMMEANRFEETVRMTKL